MTEINTGENGGFKMQIIDKIIDIIAIAAIIAILAGLLIAIWVGYVGLKIAASGTVAFATAWILNEWIRIEKKMREGTK